MSRSPQRSLPRLVLILTALSALATAEIASAQSLGATSLPSRRTLARYGLERMWWSQATINPSRDTVRHLALDEHNFYVQTTAGMVSCFDAESGRKLWAAQLGRKDQISYPVVSNDRLAMIAAGPALYAVDKFSGDSLWRLRLPGTPSARPALDDDYVYVGTLDGSLYALDLRKIRGLYEDRLLPEFSGDAIAWRYQAGERITTPPVPTGRSVNFASRDSSLYSIQKGNRDLMWQFETDEPVAAPMTHVDKLLYVATLDYRFYCLDAENGTVRWEFVTGLPVDNAPRAIGEHVFVIPARGGLFCLNALTGAMAWPAAQRRVTQFVAASPDTIYASDALDNFLMLDRDDGAVVGALPLRDFSVRLENERSDRIFLSTPSGLVVCIREQGREFPIFHKYPERRPLLPEFAPDEPAEEAPPAN